jgi:peptidoglycan/LPS O-acetylase OafA/YrhL
MPTSDRLHALDAVRAFALLGGIALHAAHPYVAGLPGWVTTETPSTALAGLWYTIHMFRMPLFFLIAGFFGRMLLERRGTLGFIRDRTRRILVPLVVGLPVVMLITGAAYFLGALATGADLGALQPPQAPAARSVLASINLMHLWFLYYLVLFYAGTLVARLAAARLFGRDSRFHRALDRVAGFAPSSAWGPVFLALPIAAYYSRLEHWSSWGGLPAPFYLVPDTGALLAYGLFFGFGWFLHRQQHLLFVLEKRWPIYGALAVGAWVVCRAIGGSTPHWGPYLQGRELLAYTTSYMVGVWCCCFALLGAAMRYLSKPSPLRRYLADSSYWLYLMHIAALFFFDQILHPLPWHWSAKYLSSIAAAMLILLLSYHYLVRFTLIGATLNGHKGPRAPREVRQSALAGSSREIGTERRSS